MQPAGYYRAPMQPGTLPGASVAYYSLHYFLSNQDIILCISLIIGFAA